MSDSNYQTYDPCPHCGSEGPFRQTISQQEDLEVEDGAVTDIVPDGSTYTVTELFCVGCDQEILENSAPSLDSEVWTEFQIGAEGLSVTLYRGTDRPTVLDEMWQAWAEVVPEGIEPGHWQIISEALNGREHERFILEDR
jgi:hypothetical protein